MIYSNQNGHHVLFAERGRWDYEMLLGKVLSYVQRYGREVNFIVEAAGSGISLYQSLRKKGLRCFYYKPHVDKMTRASYVLPIIHAGRLYILNQEGQNAWVGPYINELVSFPHGRFDDQVDSLVQGLNWAEKRVNPGGNFYSF